jgi:hypothetical protein
VLMITARETGPRVGPVVFVRCALPSPAFFVPERFAKPAVPKGQGFRPDLPKTGHLCGVCESHHRAHV